MGNDTLHSIPEDLLIALLTPCSVSELHRHACICRRLASVIEKNPALFWFKYRPGMSRFLSVYDYEKDEDVLACFSPCVIRSKWLHGFVDCHTQKIV